MIANNLLSVYDKLVHKQENLNRHELADIIGCSKRAVTKYDSTINLYLTDEFAYSQISYDKSIMKYALKKV